MTTAKGGVPGQRGAGLAQGRPRRGRRGPQGVRRAGRRDRVQPRAGAVPGRRDARRPARPVRRGGPAAEGVTRRAAPIRSTRRSTAGSGTPAGPTRSPRSSARPTRSRALLQLLPARADRRGRGASRPRTRACSGWSRSWRRRIVDRQHGRGARRERRPLPAVTLDRGAGDIRRARRRRQPAHRHDRRARALAGLAHATSTRSISPGLAGPLAGTSHGRPPTTLKRVLRRPRRDRLVGRAGLPDDRVPRDEDRLAPGRPVDRA